MVAPTGRGAEPSTLTTVAIATWLPAERQASTSGRTSFMGATHFSTGRTRVMQRGRGASLTSMVAGAVQRSGGGARAGWLSPVDHFTFPAVMNSPTSASERTEYDIAVKRAGGALTSPSSESAMT